MRAAWQCGCRLPLALHGVACCHGCSAAGNKTHCRCCRGGGSHTLPATALARAVSGILLQDAPYLQLVAFASRSGSCGWCRHRAAGSTIPLPLLPLACRRAHSLEVQQEFEALFQVGQRACFCAAACQHHVALVLRNSLPPGCCRQAGKELVVLGLGVAHPRSQRHCGDPSAPQFKARLFLEELASILLTPLLLWFSLPLCAGERSSAVNGWEQSRVRSPACISIGRPRAVASRRRCQQRRLTQNRLFFVLPPSCPAGAVLEFVEGNSVHIEGVGDVCSLAAFDFQVRCSCSGVAGQTCCSCHTQPGIARLSLRIPFHRDNYLPWLRPSFHVQRHGNARYGSPLEAPKAWRSRQGKMEKSLITFAGARAVGSGAAGVPAVHWACTSALQGDSISLWRVRHSAAEFTRTFPSRCSNLPCLGARQRRPAAAGAGGSGSARSCCFQLASLVHAAAAAPAAGAAASAAVATAAEAGSSAGGAPSAAERRAW